MYILKIGCNTWDCLTVKEARQKIRLFAGQFCPRNDKDYIVATIKKDGETRFKYVITRPIKIEREGLV